MPAVPPAGLRSWHGNPHASTSLSGSFLILNVTQVHQIGESPGQHFACDGVVLRDGLYNVPCRLQPQLQPADSRE